MVFSRCMHTSVSSDSSRGRRQTRVAIHVSITQTALRLRAGRHPARTGSVAEGPSLPSVLGKREEPVSEIRLLSLEGVGSVDHASEPFLVHGRNQSRVPSLRPAFTGHQRYYEPLAEFLATWPTGTPPLRDPLIGSAFARRGQPARVSPVPCRAVPACSPPYPGGVPRPSGASDAVCCLHREMTGSADLSLSGAYVSGLQGSLDAGPAGLLPARWPYSQRRAFDAPLHRRDFARQWEPATGRSGAYPGGTYTRKFDTTCEPMGRRPPPGDLGVARVRTHHRRRLYGTARAPNTNGGTRQHADVFARRRQIGAHVRARRRRARCCERASHLPARLPQCNLHRLRPADGSSFCTRSLAHRARPWRHRARRSVERSAEGVRPVRRALGWALAPGAGRARDAIPGAHDRPHRDE